MLWEPLLSVMLKKVTQPHLHPQFLVLQQFLILLLDHEDLPLLVLLDHLLVAGVVVHLDVLHLYQEVGKFFSLHLSNRLRRLVDQD